MIQWEIDFDYAEFEALLYDASLKAFTAIQDEHEDESFYGFALTSIDRFRTVGFSANTEESLHRFTEEKLKQVRIQNIDLSLEEIKTYFRFRVDHYAYGTLATDDVLEKRLNELLGIRQTRIDEMKAHNQKYLHKSGVSSIEVYIYEELEQVFSKVMSRLDFNGTFDKTNDRENIILDMYTGGSEVHIQFWDVCRLNSPQVTEKFQYLAQKQKELRSKMQTIENL